jgi:two-component system chemotaxis response regulator CheY
MLNSVLTPWTKLWVLRGSPAAFVPLQGRDALAAFAKWRSSRMPTDTWFLDVERPCEHTDAGAIDWTGFPDDDALAASEAGSPASGAFANHTGAARCGTARPPPMVLVVDDDPDHRLLVREVLEAEGYQVETANHGREALDRLHAGLVPNVIVLDLIMPVMDGWAFVSALKRDPAVASIPVVVTTQAGNRTLASAPVSAAYLNQPFDVTKLLQTVEVCLQRRRSA